jgi:predicted SnoaL-like aldol condensation-catalyzing enzyme
MPPVVEPPLLAMIAEGSLVMMSLRETVPARDAMPAYVTAHFNLFRLENGRVLEHWDDAVPGELAVASAW